MYIVGKDAVVHSDGCIVLDKDRTGESTTCLTIHHFACVERTLCIGVSGTVADCQLGSILQIKCNILFIAVDIVAIETNHYIGSTLDRCTRRYLHITSQVIMVSICG